MDYVFGCELPLQRAGLSVNRVHVAVAAAEEHLAVGDRGRGREDVPAVGDSLGGGGQSVQIFRLELAFIFKGENPPGLAGLDVHGDQGTRG